MRAIEALRATGVRQFVFGVAVAFALTPWATAPIALGLGLVLALLGLTAWEGRAKKASRLLIQWSIVLLGFSINLEEVARAGSSGMVFAAGTIFGTFAAGLLLGRALGTERQVTTLICSGTAICGGSAIAATGATIRAGAAQMSVALVAVFTLNAVALYAFPPIGWAMGLSPGQFGTWAAVAIHDMSSVVGAGKAYGDEALKVATVVKLARVLWIVPVSMLAGWLEARAVRAERGGGSSGEGEGKAARGGGVIAAAARVVPWFIGLFLLASVARTVLPGVSEARWSVEWGGQSVSSVADVLRAAAKQAMVVALLLIGAGLSRKALASVGWRPLVLAGALWVLISVASLAVVRATM